MNSLASLCSRLDWFETRLVENPEERFSHDEAHVNLRIWLVFQSDSFILIMVKIKLTVILMECLSINIRNETNYFTEYTYTFNSSRLGRHC